MRKKLAVFVLLGLCLVLLCGFRVQLTLPQRCQELNPKISLDSQQHQIKNGPERRCWPDGYWKLVGHWKNNKKHGVWARWFRDGKKYMVESYRQGKRLRARIYRPKRCIRKSPRLVGGQKRGPLWKCHYNGTWAYAGMYRKNLLHGWVLTWHDNGRLASKRLFSKGKPQGVGQFWDAKGRSIGPVFREVKRHFHALANGALSWFDAEHADSMGNPMPKHFPNGSSPGKVANGTYTTPAKAPCYKGKKLYPKNPARWNKQPWKSLRFAINGRHYAQYTYSVHGKGSQARFKLTARADFDCDGKYAIYTMSAKINTTTGEVERTKISVKNPGE